MTSTSIFQRLAVLVAALAFLAAAGSAAAAKQPHFTYQQVRAVFAKQGIKTRAVGVGATSQLTELIANHGNNKKLHYTLVLLVCKQLSLADLEMFKYSDSWAVSGYLAKQIGNLIAVVEPSGTSNAQISKKRGTLRVYPAPVTKALAALQS